MLAPHMQQIMTRSHYSMVRPPPPVAGSVIVSIPGRPSRSVLVLGYSTGCAIAPTASLKESYFGFVFIAIDCLAMPAKPHRRAALPYAAKFKTIRW